MSLSRGQKTLSSNLLISVTLEGKTTLSQDLSETITARLSMTRGSSLTLSFPASLTGPQLCELWDTLGLLNRNDWNQFLREWRQSREKSGAGLTLSRLTD